MRNFFKNKISQAVDFLEDKVKRVEYTNFCWSLVWNITYVCNGRCIYCTVPKHDRHPDAFKVLDTISSFRPKDFLILGGEPLLHPDIVSIIPEARERLGSPSTTLSTNLSLESFMEKVYAILPHLDRLQVSVDAPGEVNEILRGIDGELIFNRMLRIRDFIAKEGLKCKLFTQSVVTVKSMEVMEEFVKTVSGGIPGILMGFALVTPYDANLSIARDREALSRFISLVVKLKGAGYNINICDRLVPRKCSSIPASSDVESGYSPDFEVARTVRCWRQYFITQILPSGRVWRCKPDIFLYEYAKRVRGAVSSARYREAVWWLFDALDKMVLRKYNEICRFPCICNRYIEDLLIAADERHLTPNNIDRLKGRFTLRDIEAARSFLLKNYGKGIADDVASVLIGREDEGGGE